MAAVLADELDATARSSGTAAVAEAFDSTPTRRDPMSVPSEDQILGKAKELCRCEGKAWNLDDFENGVSGVTMLTVAADDDDRTEYLNRAKAFLKQKYPVRVAAIQGAHRFLSLTLG
jgi:hypothetical protein